MLLSLSVRAIPHSTTVGPQCSITWQMTSTASPRSTTSTLSTVLVAVTPSVAVSSTPSLQVRILRLLLNLQLQLLLLSTPSRATIIWLLLLKLKSSQAATAPVVFRDNFNSIKIQRTHLSPLFFRFLKKAWQKLLSRLRHCRSGVFLNFQATSRTMCIKLAKTFIAASSFSQYGFIEYTVRIATRRGAFHMLPKYQKGGYGIRPYGYE